MKPKPFWVLKNFTVPTGIIVPFAIEHPHAHRAGGNYRVFPGSLVAHPKAGSERARRAENQVAGGDINGIRRKVNVQQPMLRRAKPAPPGILPISQAEYIVHCPSHITL
jgi:hypothetical protein